MNNKKIVNVIVPIYNTAPYLRKCLNSLFRQTYSNMNIICVDDGSTDNSAIILNSYKRNSNITIVSKNNGGLSSARNAGLKYVKDYENSYIMFVDSDDWIDEHYIEKLVSYIEEYDADIVSPSFIFSTKEKEYPYKGNVFEGYLNNIDSTELLLLDETIQSHIHTKLYKSSLWKNVSFDETIYYMEDQALQYQIFYKSTGVFITNYAGYHYRQDNNNSLTKQNMSSLKAISALKAYYSPCCYTGFKEEDKKRMIDAANNALVTSFLMVIPFCRKKEIGQDDQLFIGTLKRYIKTNSLMKKYKANNGRSKLKNIVYRLCPCLYPFLYRSLRMVIKH